jgi:hypothetical protein
MDPHPVPKSVRTRINVKVNGIRCGSPALRNSVKCHFHHQHRRQLKRRAVAQTLKTPGGRMAAIQQVVDAVLTDRIDPESRTMIYAIHVGTNIRS